MLNKFCLDCYLSDAAPTTIDPRYILPPKCVQPRLDAGSMSGQISFHRPTRRVNDNINDNGMGFSSFHDPVRVNRASTDITLGRQSSPESTWPGPLPVFAQEEMQVPSPASSRSPSPVPSLTFSSTFSSVQTVHSSVSSLDAFEGQSFDAVPRSRGFDDEDYTSKNRLEKLTDSALAFESGPWDPW
jgi:hypothetical protein